MMAYGIPGFSSPGGRLIAGVLIIGVIVLFLSFKGDE